MLGVVYLGYNPSEGDPLITPISAADQNMGKQTVYSLPLQRKELSAWHSASDPGPKMPQLGRVSATRSGSETWGSARQAGGGSSRTSAGNVACLSEVCSSVSSLTHPLADGFIHSFVRSFTQPTSVDLSLWLGRNRGGRGQGWRQTAPDPVPFHVILIMTGAPGDTHRALRGATGGPSPRGGGCGELRGHTGIIRTEQCADARSRDAAGGGPGGGAA